MMSSAALHNVFVYGSLLADEVVRVLLKRVPDSFPAVLPGYHRFSIKGRVYPAILPVENKQVVGKVLVGISTPELHILDVFEDVEYVRDPVEVYREDNLEKLLAYAYVWGNKSDPNLYGVWDFELLILASVLAKEWKQIHMNDFVNMTVGFKEELEQPEFKTRVEKYEAYYQQDDKLADEHVEEVSEAMNAEESIDQASEMLLHHSDHPTYSLSSKPLDGENYDLGGTGAVVRAGKWSKKNLDPKGSISDLTRNHKIGQAYQMILQEEKQRDIHSVSSIHMDSAALVVYQRGAASGEDHKENGYGNQGRMGGSTIPNPNDRKSRQRQSED
ncbi:AIG2-like protein [Drosera capensis]